MKKPLIAAVILIMLTAHWAVAWETDFDDLRKFDRSLPMWKLGRGFTNLIGFPQELMANMVNSAIDGQYNGAYSEGFWGSMMGAVNGYIAGAARGTYLGLKRTTVGALEILTFWKPEYGPTMDPEYGTRNRAFGDQDYFDPNPYWYGGPPRW
jgi:hypothetical protein